MYGTRSFLRRRAEVGDCYIKEKYKKHQESK